ncbi:MAG: M14 family metallopeptidase [Armatimonadota bacterium]|nr:M14 family metallopeptidase [Armatimonadota bacterium]
MSEVTAPDYDHWYTYDELTEYLRRAEAEHSELCRLESLGKTPEGRDVWMLEVTDQAGGGSDKRPGFLVHANIHAKELAGTTSSLQLVHELVNGTGEEIDTGELLREVVFYIIPRLNPDGAEFALTTGGEIRSRIEERREPNCLYQADVDRDGAILDMRIERPDGDMKVSEEDERVLVPREPGDEEGPFYRVYPEGLIAEWDGGEFRWCARSHDFNRNWPANWHQEHEQGGAGDYPFSEPEMRALADFVYSHPNIFGVVGFHCGSSAVLMPPSTGALEDMNAADRKVFERLGGRAAELTGLTLLPTIDYRSADQPPIALKGHSADWGYEHMGLFHFEIEQGNVYNAAGVTTEDFFAAASDQRHVFLHDAIRYHDEHPDQEMFVDWHEFDHPQLGRVEIGGWKKHWMINPSFAELRERIAPGSARFMIEYAAQHPRMVISDACAEAVGDGIYRVRARVMNDGDLATNISELGKVLRSLEPVTVELVAGDGVEVLSRGEHHEIGQLAAHQRSGELEWFVRAPAGKEIAIRAQAQKGGVAERTLSLE